MNILILGGSGLLGQAITFHLAKTTNWNIVSSFREQKIISKLKIKDYFLPVVDLSKKSELEKIILQAKPDIVINCSAVLKINSKDDIQKAININSKLPYNLLNISTESSFKVIHFSTDCVFNGDKGNYKESDEISIDDNDIYAMTKYLGEFDGKNFLTIRMFIIGHDLFKKMAF